MAVYYVNKNGDDSTGDGLSVGTAWKTIGKAIGSSPAITMSGSGDTLRIGPGAYYESVNLGVTPGSGNVLTIMPDGGLVEWMAYTNATTKATGACLEASGKGFVTIQGMKMVGGAGTGNTGSCLNVAGAWTDWIVEDCEFTGGTVTTRPSTLCFASTNTSAMNLTIRRCDVLTSGNNSGPIGLLLRSPVHSAEFNLNALVQNCRFIGGSIGVIYQSQGGSGSNWGTGLRVQNNTFVAFYRGFYVASAPVLSTPIGAYGNAFLCGTIGINATTSGQIVEDGNFFHCTTERTNVDVGANSDSTNAPRFSIAAERISSGNPRPFLEPLTGSPMLAFGNYGTPPSVDIYNQTRPGTVSVGALERDTFDTPIYIFNVEG